MLKNKKLIRIRLKFAAAGLEYECGFSPQCTLKENLEMIKALIGNELKSFVADHEEIVADGTTSFIYDMDVTLSSYSIADGTMMIVY